jgi:hypothetical protein
MGVEAGTAMVRMAVPLPVKRDTEPGLRAGVLLGMRGLTVTLRSTLPANPLRLERETVKVERLPCDTVIDGGVSAILKFGAGGCLDSAARLSIVDAKKPVATPDTSASMRSQVGKGFFSLAAPRALLGS